jgi:uncharacterized membrane protein/pimeloyl-ACP methyl ester carboxylesterase
MKLIFSRALWFPAFSLVALLVSQPLCAETWTITDLGALPGDVKSYALGINNNGDIVGRSSPNEGNSFGRPVVWKKGAIAALPIPSGIVLDDSGVDGLVINDAGQVIANSSSGPIRWDGQVPKLVSGASRYGVAVGINAQGTVVGKDWVPNFYNLYGWRACIWTGGTRILLIDDQDTSPSGGAAINSSGAVAGGGAKIGSVIWHGSAPPVPMGKLPKGFDYGFNIRAMNDSGVVVGFSGDSYGSHRAIQWSSGAYTVLDNLISEVYGTSEALSINNMGDIVGSSIGQTEDGYYFRPVVWRNGVPTDLLKASNAKGWLDGVATGINNARQIVGYGYVKGQGTHAFLLTLSNDQIVGKPTLIDPVSEDPKTSLQNGAAIRTYTTPQDAEKLATVGRVVEGVAADGVAQIVLRIPAKSVGELVTVELKSGQCSSVGAPCIDSYGRVFDLNKQSASIYSNVPDPTVVTVPAQNTSKGAMAFVGYRAPSDFVRIDSGQNGSTDSTLGQRNVTLSVRGAASQDVTVKVVRPPVVLIHGYTSSPCSWNTFTPLVNDSSLGVYRLRYDEDIDDDVVATTPAYAIARGLHRIRANVVGVEWNARRLQPQLRGSIRAYSLGKVFTDLCGSFSSARNSIPVAVVRADVVGHSMGGLIGRAFWYRADYARASNYMQGYVHKLITIGTPHLGSHFAKRLMDGTNSCMQQLTARGAGYFTGTPNFPLEAITIRTKEGTSIVTGATADLVGDGTIEGSSTLIKILQTTSPPNPLTPRMKVALIAGKASRAQFLERDSSFPARFFENLGLFSFCGKSLNQEFLALNSSGSAWTNIFDGRENDAFVSIGSALNIPNSRYPEIPLAPFRTLLQGVVHGYGTVNDLRFGRPHEQEEQSIAPFTVRTLLDLHISTGYFTSMP